MTLFPPSSVEKYLCEYFLKVFTLCHTLPVLQLDYDMHVIDISYLTV